MWDIVIGVLLVLAAFAGYRSWKFMHMDVTGTQVVAAYAASQMMKGYAITFSILAALIVFFEHVV